MDSEDRLEVSHWLLELLFGLAVVVVLSIEVDLAEASGGLSSKSIVNEYLPRGGAAKRIPSQLSTFLDVSVVP